MVQVPFAMPCVMVHDGANAPLAKSPLQFHNAASGVAHYHAESTKEVFEARALGIH